MIIGSVNLIIFETKLKHIIKENQNFTESLEKSFRKWIRLGFRDGNLSIRDVIGRVQSLAR